MQWMRMQWQWMKLIDSRHETGMNKMRWRDSQEMETGDGKRAEVDVRIENERSRKLTATSLM